MTTWRPLDPGDAEPRRVSESLDRITRRLGGPASSVFASLFAGWEELVGPDIAAHSRPVSLRRGVLVLMVDHPAWATQLRFMTSELLVRICEAVGTSDVAEIQVRVAGAEGGRTSRKYPRLGPH